MRYAILALVMMLAVGGGYMALNMVGQPEPAQQTPVQAAPAVEIKAIDIMVAKEAIPLGTVITSEMIDSQPWPEHLMLEHFIRADSIEARKFGMVARTDFAKGEPLSASKLGNLYDRNFLAATLSPGMRAVTISVDAVSGIAGYVFPGDRVDVILTHGFIKGTGGGNGDKDVIVRTTKVGENNTYISEYRDGKKVINDLFGTNFPNEELLSEVLVESAKVLATDIRKTPAQRRNEEEKPEIVHSTQNITVEVSTEQAQKIALGAKNGSISLALRPINKGDEKDPSPTTLKDISNFGDSKKKNNDIIIIRGSKQSGGYF